MYYPLPAVSGLSSLPLSGQTLSPTTSTTSTFAVSAWPNTKVVEFTVSAQDVYVTFDGSEPTASNGLVLKADTGPLTWSIDRIKIAGFRAATNGAVVYGVPLYY